MTRAEDILSESTRNKPLPGLFPEISIAGAIPRDYSMVPDPSIVSAAKSAVVWHYLGNWTTLTSASMIYEYDDAIEWWPASESTRSSPLVPAWSPYISRRLITMFSSGTLDSRVTDRAWRVAHELFVQTTPTPSVVPGEDGAARFVWHKSGWDIELEVEGDSVDVWARNRRTGEMWDGPIGGLREQLVELLGALST